jgi:hypothetical protein
MRDHFRFSPFDLVWWVYVGLVVFLLLFFVVAMLTGIVRAQNADHDRGHEMYKWWQSKNTGNCCNNEDCRPLRPDEWTEDESGYHVRVSSRLWCPVERKHFLTRGRSPDITVAHVCIAGNLTDCNRLLCFDPPAKF